MTLAVVLASYSRATPGVNGANAALAPSVSPSVAGTVPPTVPCGSVNAPESTSVCAPPTSGSVILL